MNLKNVSMQPKLIGLMLLICLVPLASMAYWSATQSTSALLNAAYSKLTSIRSVKTTQVADVIAAFEKNTIMLSEQASSMLV
ncbi:MAG: methyl-accepting chemotaxis protein, partial [Enterobacterales bacterium]